jgi:hypothetical protein
MCMYQLIYDVLVQSDRFLVNATRHRHFWICINVDNKCIAAVPFVNYFVTDLCLHLWYYLFDHTYQNNAWQYTRCGVTRVVWRVCLLLLFILVRSIPDDIYSRIISNATIGQWWCFCFVFCLNIIYFRRIYMQQSNLQCIPLIHSHHTCIYMWSNAFRCPLNYKVKIRWPYCYLHFPGGKIVNSKSTNCLHCDCIRSPLNIFWPGLPTTWLRWWWCVVTVPS